jgi:hypothetical protein
MTALNLALFGQSLKFMVAVPLTFAPAAILPTPIGKLAGMQVRITVSN